MGLEYRRRRCQRWLALLRRHLGIRPEPKRPCDRGQGDGAKRQRLEQEAVGRAEHRCRDFGGLVENEVPGKNDAGNDEAGKKGVAALDHRMRCQIAPRNQRCGTRDDQRSHEILDDEPDRLRRPRKRALQDMGIEQLDHRNRRGERYQGPDEWV
ncbi:MAG: hypothetical protein M5U07_06355 [Xanthobacteraceae bacterium]|nr:hypothetical protein [Xanthobacteraceae bacterium]